MAYRTSNDMKKQKICTKSFSQLKECDLKYISTKANETGSARWIALKSVREGFGCSFSWLDRTSNSAQV